ncbi:cystin-1 [Microcebus murinus]|uniref:cystin-1 n=1 Tax=Microcebus murinus TaxID=30608 RepID=UPI003F6B8AA2
MGSGSSRSGRALRRRRGPENRPASPCAAAPEGRTEPRVSATGSATAEAAGAAAMATQEAAGHDPGTAAPPDGRKETLRLLDELLAESEAWGLVEPTPRGPARPGSRPATGAGSAESPEQSAGDHPGSSSVSEAPGSGHKRPERQSSISYDYSEEELMASIEREYCR